MLNYLGILGVSALFAAVLAFLLAGAIAKPLTRFAAASGTLAGGDFTHRLEKDASIRELATLADAFNNMTDKLYEREVSLRNKNEQLAIVNGRYLDLIGMVSHEIKGILASMILNTASVRDGLLGAISQQQKNALDSVLRNLEYFDTTVRNFFNLSRVEKNDVTLSRSVVSLREDIVDVSVDAYLRQATEKEMVIDNRIPLSYCVCVDPSLMQMVFNNLIGNAIKYGFLRGAIAISLVETETETTVEIFNTGRPLTPQQVGGLFKRFSRVETKVDGKVVRGTGLGLFLSHETIERHGGVMRCEPRENGNAFVFTIPKVATDVSSPS
jgi:signal transduction histidine kinase